MLIHNDRDRQEFIQKAMQVDLNKQAWIFSAEPFKQKRSQAQNKLLNVWYTEIGKAKGNGFDFERNYYKFQFGCNILARDDQDFNEFHVGLMSAYTFEQCCEAMKYIQVSSLMNTKQFTEYLEMIDQDAIKRGIYLSKPDDCYWQAMGIKNEKAA